MSKKIDMLKKSFKGLQFYLLPDEKIKTMKFNGNFILCELIEVKEDFVLKSGLITKTTNGEYPLVFGKVIKSDDEDYKVGDTIIYTSAFFRFRYYIPMENPDNVYIQVGKEDILLKRKDNNENDES